MQMLKYLKNNRGSAEIAKPNLALLYVFSRLKSIISELHHFLVSNTNNLLVLLQKLFLNDLLNWTQKSQPDISYPVTTLVTNIKDGVFVF